MILGKFKKLFLSLRNRLIFSHILPSLVIIPLMGVAMLYLLETRLMLPQIYANLSDDAILISEMTRSLPELWQNPLIAQSFVEGADPYLGGRLTLLNPYGRVLASSDQADLGLPGQIVELPDLYPPRRGEVIEIKNGPLAEAFVPVVGNDATYYGVVRMTTRLLTVSDEIYQLRFLLLGVFLIAIVAGTLLGSYLAVSISSPVHKVTEAIHALAQGNDLTILPETGIEETRILTRAVNTLVERLHTMEHSRRQLLANLVHEVGRPLGALGSATRALIKGANSDPELARDLLNGMEGELNRLHHLLDDLTRMYDQVLGPMELNLRLIDLYEWLPGLLVPWQTAAEEKGLLWKQYLSEQSPALFVDPDRLAQAVGNLCSNAIKFTPKGGEITIHTGVEGDQYWIQVSDTGIGIHPQDQGKIFQAYYRGIQDRTFVQGMGLGLTIARDIVQAHGGSIQVESEPGLGASFRLWLPIREME